MGNCEFWCPNPNGKEHQMKDASNEGSSYKVFVHLFGYKKGIKKII